MEISQANSAAGASGQREEMKKPAIVQIARGEDENVNIVRDLQGK